MALNVPGLIVMAGFYLVILGTGIWASMRSRKEEKKCTCDGMEITLLAGRKINLLVGIFTLTGKGSVGLNCSVILSRDASSYFLHEFVSTATWVGGGFILGIAEATYNPTLGAVWALMPVPYIVTFFLGEQQACLHLLVSLPGPTLGAGCVTRRLLTHVALQPAAGPRQRRSPPSHFLLKACENGF